MTQLTDAKSQLALIAAMQSIIENIEFDEDNQHSAATVEYKDKNLAESSKDEDDHESSAKSTPHDDYQESSAASSQHDYDNNSSAESSADEVDHQSSVAKSVQEEDYESSENSNSIQNNRETLSELHRRLRELEDKISDDSEEIDATAEISPLTTIFYDFVTKLNFNGLTEEERTNFINALLETHNLRDTYEETSLHTLLFAELLSYPIDDIDTYSALRNLWDVFDSSDFNSTPGVASILEKLGDSIRESIMDVLSHDDFIGLSNIFSFDTKAIHFLEPRDFEKVTLDEFGDVISLRNLITRFNINEPSPIVSILITAGNPTSRLEETFTVFDELGIKYESHILKECNRDKFRHYLELAKQRGIKQIIASAYETDTIAVMCAEQRILPVTAVAPSFDFFIAGLYVPLTVANSAQAAALSFATNISLSMPKIESKLKQFYNRTQTARKRGRPSVQSDEDNSEEEELGSQVKRQEQGFFTMYQPTSPYIGNISFVPSRPSSVLYDTQQQADYDRQQQEEHEPEDVKSTTSSKQHSLRSS